MLSDTDHLVAALIACFDDGRQGFVAVAFDEDLSVFVLQFSYKVVT